MHSKQEPTNPRVEQGILRLEGEIDLARRAVMVDEIEAQLTRTPQLIIDVSAVTFIDSTGLDTLRWASGRAHHLGGAIGLAGPCSALTRILALTLRNEQVRLYPDVRTAGEALRALELRERQRFTSA